MRIVSALVVTVLSACTGIGIVASSDPLVKLNDAEHLFMRESRPLPAERLIREAIAIYQIRDDVHGLGNANREYGDLLISQAVINWEVVYRRDGFLDRSINVDNRLEKAAEFYAKALQYYGSSEKRELAAGQYDHLTNTYFNMGLSNSALNEKRQACIDFGRSLQAYEENMRRSPAAQPQGSNAGDVPHTIAAAKRRIGCGEGG
jgi:tetratricopeptide (TPR) repeat protein